MTTTKQFTTALSLLALSLSAQPLQAQVVADEAFVHQKMANNSDSDLAQELTNPLADLMTIPVQVNYDTDIGPSNTGSKYTTNVQPVIPFDISEDWNVISRTIIPLISQEDIFANAGSQSGIGDINLSLFFSPKSPTSDGVIWGVGPVFLLPTASDELLGTEKWSTGLGGVALAFDGGFTYGALGNHIWSVAGDKDRANVNLTFLQPFGAYTWPNAWTISVQSETTYNWESKQWGVPVNAAVSKLVFLGKLPVSFQAGVGYWAESTDVGPEGVRYRFQANVVLPKL